ELKLYTDLSIDFEDEDIESLVKALRNLTKVTIGAICQASFQLCGTRLTLSCIRNALVKAAAPANHSR
ncbi:hypothetical protein FRC03_009002, partial [Tulasnella sp. 419]